MTARVPDELALARALDLAERRQSDADYFEALADGQDTLARGFAPLHPERDYYAHVGSVFTELAAHARHAADAARAIAADLRSHLGQPVGAS